MCDQGGLHLRNVWPTAGRIRFCDFWFRYSNELPWALTSISIDIAPGEKIGIVGRTGAG